MTFECDRDCWLKPRALSFFDAIAIIVSPDDYVIIIVVDVSIDNNNNNSVHYHAYHAYRRPERSHYTY